jgi:hypothetical protein
VGEIAPPPGYAVSAPVAGSFAAYLAALPLYPPDRQVLSYRGDAMDMPAYRVVDMPVGSKDLQQCADSILRLRAGWLRSVGKDPAFRYTSGDLSSWADYAAGWRLQVSGNAVRRVKAAAPDSSEAAYERWLMSVFMYAGTISLAKDSVADRSPDAGDFLLISGSPGHAVMILAVAHPTEVPPPGSPVPPTRVMIGQGFMPAMDFHVVAAPDGGAWHAVEGDYLPIMFYQMPWSGLRGWPP